MYDVWCIFNNVSNIMYDVLCVMYDAWCMMYECDDEDGVYNNGIDADYDGWWCMMYDVQCVMYVV